MQVAQRNAAVTHCASRARHSPTLAAGAGPAVPTACADCGSGFTMGGPFWAEPLHDPEWVAGLLAQVRADKDK